ncbi:hypothetical protein B0A81_11670 [Flavobacterium plurextorum]|uniref:Uncharacterized protein n=1 Tax=Flavobacterium plurextorum TaxID=1114867 RepID=A0ABX4CTN3_9FLAO|nr:hypothetical protein B0A81_11670 [Flavobacterium plurextorum]
MTICAYEPNSLSKKDCLNAKRGFSAMRKVRYWYRIYIRQKIETMIKFIILLVTILSNTLK